MPYDYFARITHSYERCAAMIGRWALECDKVLVYEHVGTETEKVHIHCILRGSRVCKKQLRNIGKDFVDLKGNENCSFKECVSEETPITYMSKGNLTPKYNKGYEHGYIEMRRMEWRPPTEHVKMSAQMSLVYSFENQHLQDIIEAQQNMPADIPIEDVPKWVFNKIKTLARTWLFQKTQIANQKFFNDYKTIVMTVCFKRNISIPKDCRWSEWL